MERMVSKYFSYEEATKTNYKLKNEPDFYQLINIEYLCENVLDRVRDVYGPTYCSSIFRSQSVNKRVGGSKTSHHLANETFAAADIVKVKNSTLSEVFNYIKDNLSYAELIWEFGDNNEPDWIHVSYSREPKFNVKETLISKKVDGETKYYIYK